MNAIRGGILLGSLVLVVAPGCGPAAAPSFLGFTPSNFDPHLFTTAGLGDIDITDSDCSIGSESVLLDCDDSAKTQFVVVTEPNQIKIGVYAAKSWRIEPNAVLTVQGNFPVVLVATGTIDVLGAIVGSGVGSTAIAGGYSEITSNSTGAGPGGGGSGTTFAAGGGGSYCGIGGQGAPASGSPVAGGPVYGTANLIPLVGGSTGGSGDVGDPGAGGGAIQLVAATSVSIEAGGSVNVGGGGGQIGGLATGQQAAGGGSGGAILIESHVVTVAGVLAANGGGGGEGNFGIPGNDATADNQPASGGDDGTHDSAGGDGSAGVSVNGGDGTATGTDTAGGGGGGAGRIRINTASGAATLGGVLSPDPTTTCVTQSTVTP